MRYGFVLPGGESWDPRTAMELAREVEAAGWDALFVPDFIYIEQAAAPTHDPWIVLAAIAAVTERVRLGPMLTPPSRRRPWKLAREAVSLDHLSRGRLILAVGLGALDDAGFGRVGEPTDARARAEMLDESLAILDGLWRGEPFGFAGRHYRFEPMTFQPTPVQRPRIPIWVAAAAGSERSMARAARWDGLLPNRVKTPEELRAAAADLAARRPAGVPYDVVWEGITPADDPVAARAAVEPWAAAGATWWIEADWFGPTTPEHVRRRIQAGPPAI